MTLPPLADVFALRDADESRLGDIEERLKAAGTFDEVWRPAPGWIAAVAPLPGSEPEPPSVRAAGLVFVEGRDRVVSGAAGVPPRLAEDVVDLVANRPDELGRLPGDFGFVHFDAAGGVTVVRSCGGLVPLYLGELGRAMALSTRLELLVRFAPGERRLDAFANAVWVTGYGYFPDARTPLEAVSLIPRGHYAAARLDGRAVMRSYWDPRPRSERELVATPEHAERLRAILVGTLDRNLDGEGNNLLTLSGGVDSSSVGALAAGVLGRPVSTLSLVPSSPAGLAHELRYIDALRSTFPFGRAWTVQLDRERSHQLLLDSPPCAFPVLHPLLWALPAVHAEQPVDVLFGGEFADEVCGAYATLNDWVAHTPAIRVLREVRHLPLGPRDVVRWSRRRLLAAAGRPLLSGIATELPLWVRPELREEYRDWLADLRARVLRDSRPLRYLTLSLAGDGWVAMGWEVTSARGIRRSIPFHTREVIELAYECHPGELLGPGTKKLLRAAVASDVPPFNLNRPDRGIREPPSDVKRRWEGRLPDELARIVRDDWFPRPPQSVEHAAYMNLMVLVRLTRELEHLAKGES